VAEAARVHPPDVAAGRGSQLIAGSEAAAPEVDFIHESFSAAICSGSNICTAYNSGLIGPSGK
jgi:hypothetical protein